MATKKVVKTPEKPKKAKVEKAETKGQYFYAVGKRKTAIAQVRIYPNGKGKDFSINDKSLEVYLPVERLAETAKSPIVATGNDGKFDVSVHVSGGGVSAQSEAVRLGIARALVKFDEALRKNLRDLGFMTRDSRKVERKKPGLKKARKSPQWAKR
ncbi:MAG: 30S ribosomal protein S9 [Candidatus Moranbacteria bacterium]|nr:30S ribosomal protein S9 [Candidatus Moranbacteria bacterium]